MSAERRRYWRPDMSLHGYDSVLARHRGARMAVAATLMGAAMLLAQIVIDRTSGPLSGTLLYSDIFIGLVTAVVTGAALWHHEGQIRAEQARVRMVAEMNHHVRNALTAISLSVYAKNDPQLEKITRESIQRIDWALREVLPNQHVAAETVQQNQEAERRSA